MVRIASGASRRLSGPRRRRRKSHPAMRASVLFALGVAATACGPGHASSDDPGAAGATLEVGRLSIKNADPSVIRVGATYISVESDGARLFVRKAASVDALSSAVKTQVWSNPAG